MIRSVSIFSKMFFKILWHQILKWSKDKNDILVHCKAGKSRSAAIAYLIECLEKSPEEAIKILDPKFHIPNELIVWHGMKIFDNQKIYEVFQKLYPVYDLFL